MATLTLTLWFVLRGVPSTLSTLSLEAACRCSVFIGGRTLCPMKLQGPRKVLSSGGTMLQ